MHRIECLARPHRQQAHPRAPKYRRNQAPPFKFGEDFLTQANHQLVVALPAILGQVNKLAREFSEEGRASPIERAEFFELVEDDDRRKWIALLAAYDTGPWKVSPDRVRLAEA